MLEVLKNEQIKKSFKIVTVLIGQPALLRKALLAGTVFVLVLASYILLNFPKKGNHSVVSSLKPSLSSMVYSSQTNPQDFYLAVVSDDKTDGQETSYGQIFTINGQEFSPYRLIKTADTQRIEWKSLKGIQSILITKNSPQAELYEDIGYGWELRAVATPEFQYKGNAGQPASLREALLAGWENYALDFSSAQFQVDQQNDLADINLFFNAVDQSGGVIPATSQIKIGFDGTRYINEWVFKLDSNQNINRFSWNVVKDKEEILSLAKSNGTFLKLKPERQLAVEGKRSNGFMAAMVGDLAQGAIKSDGSGVQVSVADFIKQNNGDKNLIQQESNNYLFYPAGQAGELVIDPTLSVSTAVGSITIQTTTGTPTANDFKLVFNAADAGVSSGSIGDGATWVEKLSATNLLTMLNQTANQVDAADGVITLLEATTTRTVVRNSFSLGANASVVEDWSIYPTGKIVKKITYTKNNTTNDETRTVLSDATFVSGSGYFGGMPSISRSAATYTDTQTIRLKVNSANTAEITDYQTPDQDLGLLKGFSWDEDATSTADFNTWDGSYSMSITATDTAVYIADYDATYANSQPIFKIRGWTTATSTPVLPNYVALNGTTLTRGTDYNASLVPISTAYYAIGSSTTTAAAGGDLSSSSEYFASSTNNLTMAFTNTTDYLYMGFDSTTTGVTTIFNRVGVGGTLNWQYCSAVTAGACTTWSSLTTLATVSGANNFTATGTVYWLASSASGWVAGTPNISVATAPSLYYIRVYRGTAFSTAPIEKQLLTDILMFQYTSSTLATNDNSFVIAYASKTPNWAYNFNFDGAWSPSGALVGTENVLVQNGQDVTFNTSLSFKNLFVANGGIVHIKHISDNTAITLTTAGSIIASGVLDVRGFGHEKRAWDWADFPRKIQIISSSAGENGIIVENTGTMTLLGSMNIDSDYTFAGEQRTVQITQSGSNNAYMYFKDGAEALIQNADISYMGTNSERKQGIYADKIDGGTANEKLVITGSLINNGYDGVHLANSTDITISNNWFFANQNDGVYLATSSAITLYGNTMSSSTNASLEFQNSTNNNVINNTFDNNSAQAGTQTGILVDTASDANTNTIKNNIVTNSDIGISSGLTNTTGITYNLFSGNTSAGTTGSNSLSSDPLFVSRQTSSSYGNNADDFALATSSPALGAGSPANTNIGGWLGYIKNVTDNKAYGLHNSAVGDPSLGAGDTVTTYTVDNGTSTISAMSDQGEFLQITASSNLISANNQLVGNYMYINSGTNRGLYYLITDATDNGSSDTFTINASTTLGFAWNDSFTIIDRVYSRNDGSLICLGSAGCLSYAGYAILNATPKQGLADLPITFNTSGTVVFDLQTKLSIGIFAGTGSSPSYIASQYLVFDGFKIMNSVEYIIGTAFGAGVQIADSANNITVKNADTYLMGGLPTSSFGAPGISVEYFSGGVAPSNIIIENVNSFFNEASGVVIRSQTGGVNLSNISLKNVKAFSNLSYGLLIQRVNNFVVSGGEFYGNNVTAGDASGNYIDVSANGLIDGAKFYNTFGTGTTSGGSGLTFAGSTSTAVINSSFFGNGGNGIFVGTPSGVTNYLFKNNLFFANARTGIVLRADQDNASIYNNTFDANRLRGVQLDDAAATDPNSVTIKNNLFTNNLVYGLSEGATAGGGITGTVSDYNYYYNNASNTRFFVTSGQESHSFFANASSPGVNDVNPGYISDDSGTATAGSTSSLQDSSKSWVPNQWIGSALKIASIGGGATTTAIISNTTSTLTVAPALSTAISSQDYTITSYYISATSTATASTPLGKGVNTVSGVQPSSVNIGARLGFVQNATDSINANSLQSAHDATGFGGSDNLDIVAINATSTTISSATSTNGSVAFINITVPNNIIMSNDQYNGMYLYIDSPTANYSYRYFPIIDSSSTEDVFVIPVDNGTNTSTTAANFTAGTPIKVVDRVYNKRGWTDTNANGGRTAILHLTKNLGTSAVSPITWTASSTGAVIIDAGYDYFASSTNVIYGDGGLYNRFIASSLGLILRGASAYTIGASSTGATGLEFWGTSFPDTNQVEPITPTNSYVLSRRHNATNGDWRLWGEYAQPSGTLSINYANESYSGGGDTNTAKTLKFMQDGDKLTVASGATLQLTGQSGSNTTLTHGASGNWSMVMNGAIDASYYTMDYLDNNGMQINSGATVTSLSNGIFTNFGTALASSTAILINPLSITSNKSFSGMSFTTSEAGDNNASTTATSGSSFWWFFGGSSGETKNGLDADPGMLIWTDSAPTAPTIGSATALSSSSITWNFTDNAINETGFNIVNNSGVVKATSASVDLSSLTETGLSSNTRYGGVVGQGCSSSGEEQCNYIPSNSSDCNAIGCSWNSVGEEYSCHGYPTCESISSSGLCTQVGCSFSGGVADSNTRYVQAYNSNSVPISYATSSTNLSNVYTLAPTPNAFYSDATSSSQLTLNVAALNNQTDGSSGYFFNRTTGQNSGWIQTNTWTDTGLSPDTQYSYAVAYRNGDGYVTASTTLANMRTAATTPGAPTLSNASANSIDIVVNANSNPSNITFAIQEVGGSQYVQSGGTLGSSAVWQSAATWGTKTVSGLSAGTGYAFKVKAKNSDGVETGFGSTASLSTSSSGGRRIIPSDTPTPEVPVVAPQAPSALAPQPISAVKIRWYFKDNSTNESGFKLKDSTGKVLASVVGTDLTYIEESGLSPNTRYSGRQVVAYNAIGESASTGELSAVYTLAATPGIPTVQILSDTSVKLIINANQNPDFTPFLIKENNNLKYVNKLGLLDSWVTWQTLKDWGGSTGIIITGLTSGQEYSFVIKAKNADGTETDLSPSATFVLKDNIPPVSPQINYPINGAILRTNQFSITGKTEPNAKVSIKLDNTDFGFTVTAGEDGNFAYNLPKTLDDGAHTIAIIVKDEAGNLSIISKTSFTIKMKREGQEEPAVSLNKSSFNLSQSSLKVTSTTTLSVVISDADGNPLAGHQIKVLSSGLDKDLIKGKVSQTFREVTGITGQATFSIYSQYAHRAILSIYDETDEVLLTNNLVVNFNALEPFFIIVGSSRFILQPQSLFNFNDGATIDIHLEDKLRNVILDQKEVSLTLNPALGSLSKTKVVTKDGYAKVNYSSPGGDALPSPVTQINIIATVDNLAGQITLIVTRPPTPVEQKEEKEKEIILEQKKADYAQKVDEALAKGQEPPPLPPELVNKKVVPLPEGVSASSAAGTISLAPDDMGRIIVVAGQSFEVLFKPTQKILGVSIFALDKEYIFTDKNHDGTYETTLLFGKEEKGKEITMLIVEKYANGQIKISPLSALIDPYGYVFTKVSTDPKKPLVMNGEQRIENVRVLLYVLNTKTQNWEKWPAQRYFQENPLFSNKQGEYSFMVPEGDYYLTAYKDGYQLYRSKRLTVENAKPVNLNIFLATKYTPVEKLQNLLNLVGIETNLPDSVLYLFVALAAILILGIPLIIWLVIKVVRARSKSRFEAKL